MSFLPEFSEEDTKIMKSGKKGASGQSDSGLARSSLHSRILPSSERALIAAREDVMIGEDEDLVEWERVVRDYLNQLPNGRHNRVTGILIWEWATGKSTSEAHKKGESTLYLRDIRRINKILRSYFGDSRQTFINGRKFSRVFDMRKGFIVDRKAPHCLSLYLEWKRGAKVR